MLTINGRHAFRVQRAKATYPLGGADGALHAGVRQRHDELLAAKRAMVRLAQVLPTVAATCTNAVAHGVAVLVVDLLEEIPVDAEQVMPRADGAVRPLLAVDVGKPRRFNAGQRVEGGTQLGCSAGGAWPPS